MKTPAICLILLLAATAASAQPRGGKLDTPAPFGAGEIQKLLDGYAIVQAQEFVGLSDAQFGTVLPRLRALQDVRRQGEQERLRLLIELRRLTNPRAQTGEAEIRDRMRALRDLQARSAGEVQRAYDAIDQLLDIRQQARFRVFEQELEQRKLQLLMRARQQNRANRPLANPQ
jgi:hypothetical protein